MGVYLFRLSVVGIAAVLGSSYVSKAQQFDTIIHVPPTSIHSNTQLNVAEGGNLPSSSSKPFQAGLSDGSSTNVEVNVIGGDVGDSFAVNAGAVVNMANGGIGLGLRVSSGGRVKMAGGRLDSYALIQDGGSIRVTGGTIGDYFYTSEQSDVTFVGSDFRVNGETLEGLSSIGDTVVFTWPSSTPPPFLLTGVLADGTPFAFTSLDGNGFTGDRILDGVVTLVEQPLPPAEPRLLTPSLDPVPLGIRAGQALVVDGGGLVGNHFNVGWDSKVTVLDGGQVGDNMEAVGARIDVLGGIVGSDFDAFAGSIVRVAGGRVGSLDVFDGSQVLVSGGTVNTLRSRRDGSALISDGVLDQLRVENFGQAILAGGEVSQLWVAHSGSLVLAGGTIDEIVQFSPNSDIQIFGTNFQVDGSEIDGFELGKPTTVDVRRGSVLTATLQDGLPFRLDDGDFDSAPVADLRLVTISLLDGDYNSNGTVEQAVLDLVLLNWGQEFLNPFATGWINDLPKGLVDQDELDGVLLNWGNMSANVGTASVPEPSGLAVIGVSLGALALATARPMRNRGCGPAFQARYR